MQEGKNGRDSPEAGRDGEQAVSGGGASISGKDSCISHPIDRGYRSKFVSLAERVRRSQA